MLYSGHPLFHKDVIAQSLSPANRAFVAWLKISRLCRPHKISPIAMSPMFCTCAFLLLSLYTLTLTSSSSIPSSRTTSQVTLPINKHCDDPQNHEYGSVAKTTSSTGLEPIVIDNFDYSETCTAMFQNDSVDVDTEPSYSFDAELDDELIRKALSSPLFTHEREESANLRQTYHSHEQSLLPSPSFFTQTSTLKPVYEPSSNLFQKRKSSRDL